MGPETLQSCAAAREAIGFHLTARCLLTRQRLQAAISSARAGKSSCRFVNRLKFRSADLSRSRQQPDQAAVVAVGQDIDEPVRPLTHIADALAQILQEFFLRHDRIAVEI